MSMDQSADMLWIVLASTLVISALLARRVSFGGALGMALGWIAIFGAVLVLFTYAQDFGSVATRVRQEITGAAAQRAEGERLHVRMASDGHFWVNGEINGMSARFLIDSGATVTAISDDVARQAGLNVDESGPGVVMRTANGAVLARRSSINGLTLGPVRTNDLPVIVSERFNGVNVLGMNFLSRLKSWRVENGEMVLEP